MTTIQSIDFIYIAIAAFLILFLILKIRKQLKVREYERITGLKLPPFKKSIFYTLEKNPKTKEQREKQDEQYKKDIAHLKKSFGDIIRAWSNVPLAAQFKVYESLKDTGIPVLKQVGEAAKKIRNIALPLIETHIFAFRDTIITFNINPESRDSPEQINKKLQSIFTAMPTISQQNLESLSGDLGITIKSFLRPGDTNSTDHNVDLQIPE